MTCNKIKAILFDMDGVLIDAKEWHYQALNNALAIFGNKITLSDHLNIFDGLPTRKKLQMLSESSGFPEQLHDFVNEMKQIYTMKIVNEKCAPNFTHEYAISRLKKFGYKLAVCSNSIKKTINTMMEKSCLIDYFDIMLSNEDVKNGKPAPDIYLKAMKHLELMPKECLIVEDNEHGIKAAEAAGGHVLVVKKVCEVNYNNIINKINFIESNKI